jgi:hypothetical protein
LDEPLCLADFNHTPTVAAWLRQRKAALLAPFKDDTSFERQDQRRAATMHYLQ